ncbi:MAG: HIT domain-containing protein [Rickettsiales bacterium]|jgi:diadenosine tetraphosphate (Ap4A) HIT family hydrolase|nr:HIT domain-containing protein [Rickettsiales bacterium]
MYDRDNVFARILRGELPCDKVSENRFAIAINDASPRARVHVLVVPRGEYADLTDFLGRAGAEEKAGVLDLVREVALGLGLDGNGYRVVANIGKWGGQAVPHLHFHILGGEPLANAL